MVTLARLGQTLAQVSQTVAQPRQGLSASSTPFLARTAASSGFTFSDRYLSKSTPAMALATLAASAMASTTVAGPRRQSPAA